MAAWYDERLEAQARAYEQAQAILEMRLNRLTGLEQEKIIGPYEGAKPRAVLVTKAEWEERKLNGQYDG